MMRLSVPLLVATLLVGGCGGDKKVDPTGPVAGLFTVSYAGPGQTDGAMLVLVSGSVTSVTSAGGYTVASGPVGTTQTRVVITGQLTVGDVFKIAVPDVSKLASYSAQVEAVADRTTYALQDPISYAATIRK